MTVVVYRTGFISRIEVSSSQTSKFDESDGMKNKNCLALASFVLRKTIILTFYYISLAYQYCNVFNNVTVIYRLVICSEGEENEIPTIILRR